MHAIEILLSESAQRAAILAGQPASARQTYTVPPELLPRLLALPFATITGSGDCVCAAQWLGGNQYVHPRVKFEAPARPADAEAAIAWAETFEAAESAYLARCDAEAAEKRREADARAAKYEANERSQAAERVKANEAAAEKLTAFRSWAATNGSELLRARVAGNYDWQALAEREWAEAHVATLGPVAVEGEDWWLETRDLPIRTTPTLAEMKWFAESARSCRTARRRRCTG